MRGMIFIVPLFVLNNMGTIFSKNGVPIRLTDERWLHITEEHSELAGYYFEVLETLQEPEEIEPGKYMVVVYKEDITHNDGFVITAFLTRRIKQVRRRNKLWPQ